MNMATYYKVVRIQVASDNPEKSWETVYDEKYETRDAANARATRLTEMEVNRNTFYRVRSFSF